jgi:hypothetical protein
MACRRVLSLPSQRRITMPSCRRKESMGYDIALEREVFDMHPAYDPAPAHDRADEGEAIRRVLLYLIPKHAERGGFAGHYTRFVALAWLVDRAGHFNGMSADQAADYIRCAPAVFQREVSRIAGMLSR